MGSFISRLINNLFKEKKDMKERRENNIKERRGNNIALNPYNTITINSPEEFNYYINEIAGWTYVVEETPT